MTNYNKENRDEWKKSGVVETIKWYTAEDEKVCDVCKKMHGKSAGVDKSFKTPQGEVYIPQELHKDCRCYLRPDKISTD